ncbi:hypothetical protein K502DRAFT_366802 [Neoconidiobolus thromboides FSU 785]|nr:hypothetical protein K502DRAFT_366802 [Neoconidiobolus thromboides FSU 785]
MAFKYKNNKKWEDKGSSYTSKKDSNNEVSELKRQDLTDMIDETMGFHKVSDSEMRLGWLVNMQPALVQEAEHPEGRAGVDLYFILETGDTFKLTYFYKPYFLVLCKDKTHREVQDYLLRQYPSLIDSIELIVKEDLALQNHLSGNKRELLKLSFMNVSDLLTVRKTILPIAQTNEAGMEVNEVFSSNPFSMKDPNFNQKKQQGGIELANSALKNIIGIREYDVPYLCRVAIDNNLRVGLWYDVRLYKDADNGVILTRRADKVNRADPVVLAFDIETTKQSLKFPDPSFDTVMMISYMVDGEGYLITNRDVITKDIIDFEYNPKEGLEGAFKIFNEKDEKSLLIRFFEHIKQLKPTVIATYNGDFFDWPFVDKRAQYHGLDMYSQIGFKKDENDEYKSSYCIHMDCLSWVKRDSYLPAGSHGLKAVAKAKLAYQPLEFDPEDMVRAAREEPETLARYSVSDAVATYYLYMKYVHPFIFSLCNIIPTMADDVLRKGSGTLCEYLLMVEAYNANVLMPNKHNESQGKLFNGHLIESETYVGGHVEALEAGVFRSDIPERFNIQSKGIDTLINQLDNALKFSLTVESSIKLEDVDNYEEVYQTIKDKLLALKSDKPIYVTPLIYHLDVGAMYPNIILTNRLQPDAMVDEATCASCNFNVPDKVCDRKMTWSWRGEYYPANQSELNMIRNQLGIESFPGKKGDTKHRTFDMLSPSEQSEMIKQRLKAYSSKVYKKTKISKVIERTSTVCQKENPFYIDTVRNFRDRRYEYKGLHKKWKSEVEKAKNEGRIAEMENAQKLVIVYDSLQLAHKCILNSFYGYVMRKGSRWYSMEMGGIVCLTGAKIIQMARQLVDQIGRPLELDTDGIWCILPSSFPETFAFKLKNGKSFKLSYPCTMLNHLVHDKFTNDQYHELDSVTNQYSLRSENSIFFEVDGPYRAMILPASKEADKLLKKRYAVFNKDGSLAELKGFEIKRRGELKLVKIFQSQIFAEFLKGDNLKECYEAVAKVANNWLNILFSKGGSLQDSELFELIAENRSMSRSLSDYGEQKSTSISTAKRLAEFLGDEMVKDKGLACQFIVSKFPVGIPVSERAIPTAIFFETNEAVKFHFLRKWLREPSLEHIDLRDILDWEYYIERFGSVIQKIITIPAAMQKVPNPVPRVPHPDWLSKRISMTNDRFQQRRITDMFQLVKKDNNEKDIEDFGTYHQGKTIYKDIIAKVTKKRKEPTAGEALELLKREKGPDIKGNYSEWIQFQNKKWRLNRQLRIENKKQRNSNHKQTDIKNNIRLSGYDKMTRPYLYASFQVLQITGTDMPGYFKMFILINSQMHTISLKVSRTVYLNVKTNDINGMDNEDNDSTMKFTKSDHRLPRNYPSMNLQKLQVNESYYQNNFTEFNSLFNHCNVEGAYESKAKLINNIMIKLGCICAISDNIGQIIPQHFELDMFYREPVTQGQYLNNNIHLNYLIILHYTQGLRHMILVFSPATKNGLVLVVDGSKKPISQLPNLTSTYQTQFITYVKDNYKNPHLILPDNVNFETSFFDKPQNAWSAVQKFIVQYQANKLGPTILLLDSPHIKELSYLVKGFNDYPIANISSLNQRIQMPALGWQNYVYTTMLVQLFSVPLWLKDQIAWANFSNVPLCNLSEDLPLMTADITFARQLRSTQQVLWWSDSDLPDLGGKEFDDFRYLVDNDMTLPNLNFPTAHASVCFEISLEYLAINSILNSHLINELEGGSSMYGISESNNIFRGFKQMNGNNEKNAFDNINDGTVGDITSINPMIFDTLKNMIKKWCDELIHTRNPFYEQMMNHCYRWLSTMDSKLYDVQLHALIIYLMKKLFAQLLVFIKSIGAVIIHATTHRLILGTNKVSRKNGHSFAEYVLQSILEKPLFRNLGLSITLFWDRLIWMSPSNYGGIIYKAEENQRVEKSLAVTLLASQQLESTPVINVEDALYWLKDVEMNWSIAHYLPSLVRPYFDIIIGKYIYDIHQVRRELNSNGVEKNIEEVNEEEIVNITNMVVNSLKARLFGILGDFTCTNPSDNDGDNPALAFPMLPGSPYLSNPQNNNLKFITMEWIKNTFAVFELDHRLSNLFSDIKFELFEAIDVSPYAPETKFQVVHDWTENINQGNMSVNSSLSKKNPQTKAGFRSLYKDKSARETQLRLPKIVCSYCNFSWEINFYEHLIAMSNLKMQQRLDNDIDQQNNLHHKNEAHQIDKILESNSEEEDNEMNYFNENVDESTPLNKDKATDDLVQIQNEKFEGLCCPSCSSLYPTAIVEKQLIIQLQQNITAFQVQDVECPKCDHMPTSILPSKCSNCTIEVKDVQFMGDKMRGYYKGLVSLAKLYGLDRLHGMVEELMRL